jgi:hypothetical protein
MAEDGNFRVEKFNSQNYQVWKMHIEYFLYQKDQGHVANLVWQHKIQTEQHNGVM